MLARKQHTTEVGLCIQDNFMIRCPTFPLLARYRNVKHSPSILTGTKPKTRLKSGSYPSTIVQWRNYILNVTASHGNELYLRIFMRLWTVTSNKNLSFWTHKSQLYGKFPINH